MQMPPRPRERDFYEELLGAMGAAVPAKLSVSNLRARVRVLARQLGVRMFLIDDINSMLSGTFREQRIFLNALRFLANDLQLALVCAGTPEAKQALLTDQQLAERFEARELPAWRDEPAFHQFLASFGASLPLRQASGLQEPALRKRILSLSEGITGRICRLLEEAAVQAILSGRERIELEALSEELLARSLASIAERRRRAVVARERLDGAPCGRDGAALCFVAGRPPAGGPAPAGGRAAVVLAGAAGGGQCAGLWGVARAGARAVGAPAGRGILCRRPGLRLQRPRAQGPVRLEPFVPLEGCRPQPPAALWPVGLVLAQPRA
jgi:hypothetical protein